MVAVAPNVSAQPRQGLHIGREALEDLQAVQPHHHLGRSGGGDHQRAVGAQRLLPDPQGGQQARPVLRGKRGAQVRPALEHHNAVISVPLLHLHRERPGAGQLNHPGVLPQAQQHGPDVVGGHSAVAAQGDLPGGGEEPDLHVVLPRFSREKEGRL